MRDLGHAFPGSGEPFEKIMPMMLLLISLLNWWSCLASPMGSLSIEKKNAALVSQSHREQDKATRGKWQEVEYERFLQTTITQTWHKSHSCPACRVSQKPFPTVSWKRLSLCCSEMVGTGMSLKTASDFSFTCLWHRDDTKRKSLSCSCTEQWWEWHQSGKIQSTASQWLSSCLVPVVMEWPTHTLSSSG